MPLFSRGGGTSPRRRRRSYLDPGKEIQRTTPRPPTLAETSGFARLEDWLGSALDLTSERLQELCGVIREKNIARPIALAGASDDILTECGFGEDEKLLLRRALRQAGASKMNFLVPWDSSSDEKRPVRVTELVVVSSTRRVIQIGFLWTQDQKPVEKRFPEAWYCGDISIRRLALYPGEYVIALTSTFQVVSSRSWTTSTPTLSYQLVALTVKTNKRRKLQTKPLATSSIGRTASPTHVIVREQAPSKDSGLVGLSFVHTKDGAIEALGGIWAPTKADDDVSPPSSAPSSPHREYDFAALDTRRPPQRNAYTGARINEARFDPWLREDSDPTVVVATARSLFELPAVSLVPVGAAVLVPTPRHSDYVVARPIPNDVDPIHWPVAPTALPSPPCPRPLRRDAPVAVL